MPLYRSGFGKGGAPPAADDASAWLLHDRGFTVDEAPARMFWDVARVEEATIPAPVTNDPTQKDFYLSHAVKRFPGATGSISGVVTRVSLKVRLTPFAPALLEDLTNSGHLDPALAEIIPTFDLIANRHLADDPTLAALASSTFEWSDRVRASGKFDVWTDETGVLPKECIGMRRAQR